MPLHLDGGCYGLRQVDTTDKTVLLMKLTDSALRIIESYQDHSGGIKKQPSIHFQGNQGVIQIPTMGGNGDPEFQDFTFQVSNLTQSAGVDCLQQIHSGQRGRIESMGSIQQKVTINATDDSYNMTRKRMNMAKEEELKISTKVIKQPSSSKMGKLLKKRTGKNRIVEKQQNHAGRMSPDTRAPTPPVARVTPNLHGNRSSSPLTIPNKDRSNSPPGAPGSGRNKTKPTISISSSSSNNSNANHSANNAASSIVAARPLWDRVAHLLAVRPYKYPEIVLRLGRDKAPDKSRLQTILQQVAMMRTSSSGTEYSLNKGCYSSIEPDWPGYSENEKKAVIKKLAEFNGVQENRKRPYAASLSPSHAAAMPEDDEYSNPQIKKQRVSHYKKPSPSRPSPGPPPVTSPPKEQRPKPESPPASSGISFGTTKLPPKNSGSGARHRAPEPPKVPTTLDLPDHGFNEAPMLDTPQEHRNSPVKSSKRSKNHKYVNPSHTNEDEDYMKKYIQISSVEQRDRYKSDFYAEYQEYLCHHSNVAAVSERFAELQRNLNEHKKGSEEYKAISRQVIQEYKKTKKNDAYHQERARMQFLHRKLQHIKLLVNDFDRHKLANRSDNDPGLCIPTKTATRVN